MNDNNARNRDELKPQFNATPAHPATNKDLPLGDRVRSLLDPALNDDRCKEVQLEALDTIFAEFAPKIQGVLERTLGGIFNQAANIDRNEGQDGLNLFIMTQLVKHKDGFAPVVRMELPFNPYFTEFNPKDICMMPGYIKLHEKLRDLNVAVKLVNITADESKSPYGPQPCYLIVDMSKSYQEGAMENATLYPDLPEVTPQFGKSSKSTFKFD